MAADYSRAVYVDSRVVVLIIENPRLLRRLAVLQKISMESANHLLDRYAQVNGLTSDYQIAKHLGVTPQAISNVRRGRGRFGNTTAVLVAESIGADPMAVIAQLEIERAADSRVKTVWGKYCARVLLAFVAATLTWGVAPTEAEASACNVYYVKSWIEKVNSSTSPETCS